MNQVFKTLYQNGAQPREIWIICPFAGGSLSAFKTWMSLDCNALAKETLVLLATYPGRDHRMRERPLTSIEAIAEDVAEGLRTWIADQTFTKETQIILCGHSMGAQVAYEVCHRFESSFGALSPIKNLILSACHAPHLSSRRRLSQLNDDDFIDQLIAIGSGSPILKQHPELLPLFLPMLRADFLATECYYQQVNYYQQVTASKCLQHTPCTLVFGEHDPEAWESEVAAWQPWLMPIGEKPTLIAISGDHFYITATPEHFLNKVTVHIPTRVEHRPTPPMNHPHFSGEQHG